MEIKEAKEIEESIFVAIGKWEEIANTHIDTFIQTLNTHNPNNNDNNK